MNHKECGQVLKHPMDFISYIPNGMHSCVLNGDVHLEYASDGLCKMLGYTREEFEALTQGKYTEVLHPEDREAFVEFVYQLAEKPQLLSIEYRLVRKDGSILYVCDTMESVQYEDGTMMGYSSVMDITELKKKEQELKKSKEEYEKLYHKQRVTEERLRMASKYSGIIFYEYDVSEKQLTTAINVEKILGYEEKNFLEAMIADELQTGEVVSDNALIHKDDKHLFKMAREKLDKTGEAKCEVRIRGVDGEYRWNILNFCYIEDSEGNVASVVGCICDVDKAHRNFMELKEFAQKEPMTELYNKVSANLMISQILKERRQMKHALLVFDLDNFKKVNDTYGHAAGDKVVIKVAELMRSIFRKEDVLSRFGGDEFVVFISDIESCEAIEERLQHFQQVFRKYAKENYPKVPLSVSVGAVLSSGEASLDELFEKADRALYEAKKNQKDQYVFFEE